MSDIQTLNAAAERITGHNIQLRAFLLRLLDPDDLGYAVTAEVRELASRLLVMERMKDESSTTTYTARLTQ